MYSYYIFLTFQDEEDTVEMEVDSDEEDNKEKEDMEEKEEEETSQVEVALLDATIYILTDSLQLQV